MASWVSNTTQSQENQTGNACYALDENARGMLREKELFAAFSWVLPSLICFAS